MKSVNLGQFRAEVVLGRGGLKGVGMDWTAALSDSITSPTEGSSLKGFDR